MGMNRIQFQPGLSLEQLLESFGTEEKCEEALERVRWPEGFQCPKCGHGNHLRVQQNCLLAVQLADHEKLAPPMGL